MEEIKYIEGRIYQVITKDITGDFDVSAEIDRLTKERDAIDAKIKALSGAKVDMDLKAMPVEEIITK